MGLLKYRQFDVRIISASLKRKLIARILKDVSRGLVTRTITLNVEYKIKNVERFKPFKPWWV